MQNSNILIKKKPGVASQEQKYKYWRCLDEEDNEKTISKKVQSIPQFTTKNTTNERGTCNAFCQGKAKQKGNSVKTDDKLVREKLSTIHKKSNFCTKCKVNDISRSLRCQLEVDSKNRKDNISFPNVNNAFLTTDVRKNMKQNNYNNVLCSQDSLAKSLPSLREVSEKDSMNVTCQPISKSTTSLDVNQIKRNCKSNILQVISKDDSNIEYWSQSNTSVKRKILKSINEVILIQKEATRQIYDKEMKKESELKPLEKIEVKGVPASMKSIQCSFHIKPKAYFFISGMNGARLVEEFCRSLGWKRTYDKWRRDCKLRWCEVKTIDYYRYFCEGEQLCYQIPNNNVLTTKIGLLNSLKEYERFNSNCVTSKLGYLNYRQFLPETYRLDLNEERNLFLNAYADNDVWISKPTGMNQGKGIHLIRSKEDIVQRFEQYQTNSNARKKLPMARIVQRYIDKPLLLDGRKFDIRNYLLIACAKPLVVFYADGYCRRTCVPYNRDNPDLTSHLTNQFMQKKSPLYSQSKEDIVWSMERFNSYCNRHFVGDKGIPENWVDKVLKNRCQDIMLHCLKAVRHKLKCQLGFFDLFGCDFLIDEKFKILLLEMNCNPSLYTSCKTLKLIIPNMVHEALNLTFEIFEKVRQGQRVLPLAAQEKFVLLYNGDAEPKEMELRKTAQERPFDTLSVL